MATILFSIPINRAIRQQRAVSLVYKCGRTVTYDNKEPSWGIYDASRPETNSLILNLQYTVAQIHCTFYDFNDEMRDAVAQFTNLRTITLGGHDSKFGAGKLQDEFPHLEVVGNQARWRAYL